jgi:hypothetical protein
MPRACCCSTRTLEGHLWCIVLNQTIKLLAHNLMRKMSNIGKVEVLSLNIRSKPLLSCWELFVG